LGVGGGAISHVGEHSYYLCKRAIAYESGTPAVGAAIGMQAAIEYLQALGVADIEARTKTMTAYAREALECVAGIRILGDHHSDGGLCGILSFTVHAAQEVPISCVLGRLGVAVRSGNHCIIPMMARLGLSGSTRATIGVHTTKADIEACAFALQLATEFLQAEEPRV
jgi:cysteine desulfurase/selenocysteine lyase